MENAHIGVAPIVSTLKMDSAEACAVRYAYGHTHFKINSVTKASQLLPKVGKECNGLNDDVGAKALVSHRKIL